MPFNLQIALGVNPACPGESLQSAMDPRQRVYAFVFTALWLLILIVAVVDGYLLLVNWQVIGQEELNPVGRLLLALDGGKVRCFFVAKCGGTLAASSVLLVLYWTRMRMGLAVAAGNPSLSRGSRANCLQNRAPECAGLVVQHGVTALRGLLGGLPTADPLGIGSRTLVGSLLLRCAPVLV